MRGELGHSSVNVTRIAKADGQADPQEVYRLTDMEVEEVSLVDRAANKRKFLVVKRSDQMGTQIQPDGKGGFTTSNGTAKAGAAPAPPAAGGAPPGKEKDKEKPKPTPPAMKPPVGKAGGLEVPPGFKEMMGPLLEKAAERLQALADNVQSSKPAEMTEEGDLPSVPAEFANELAAIVASLEKAGSMWPNAPAELTDEEGEGDADQEGEAGAGSGDGAMPAVTQMQLRATEKTIGQLGVFAKRALAKKETLAKIGAKMSKDRLTRLQDAVSSLSNLVNEVAGAPALPPAPAEKAASADVAELTKAVTSLTGIVKTMHGEIATLKKSRGAPSSATVDARGAKIEKDDFAWPGDMNDGRDPKQESFFDK